jgi:hypothetical protein
MAMRTLVLAVAVGALIVPATALGKKPTQPGAPAAAKPTVSYVLRGTLSAYTAANGAVNGSVTLVLSAANHQAKLIAKGTTLTFPVSSNTNVVLHAGSTTIANGDRGIVKVRGPKGMNAAAAALVVPTQVIDQGTK